MIIDPGDKDFVKICYEDPDYITINFLSLLRASSLKFLVHGDSTYHYLLRCLSFAFDVELSHMHNILSDAILGSNNIIAIGHFIEFIAQHQEKYNLFATCPTKYALSHVKIYGLAIVNPYSSAKDTFVSISYIQ